MNIFIIVLTSLILGAIVVTIGVRHELEKAPEIKLIQGKPQLDPIHSLH